MSTPRQQIPKSGYFDYSSSFHATQSEEQSTRLFFPSHPPPMLFFTWNLHFIRIGAAWRKTMRNDEGGKSDCDVTVWKLFSATRRRFYRADEKEQVPMKLWALPDLFSTLSMEMWFELFCCWWIVYTLVYDASEERNSIVVYAGDNHIRFVQHRTTDRKRSERNHKIHNFVFFSCFGFHRWWFTHSTHSEFRQK